MSLRAFIHPRVWQSLFALAIATVVVLSLVPNRMLRRVDVIGNDKIGHALAYFVLMAFAVQLRDSSRDWIRCALGLLAMSIVIEFVQQASGLRRGDPHDVIANAIGLLLGLLVAHTPARDALLAIDRRISRPR